MKKSNGYLRLSLAAGFMALLPLSAHANLISNGNFSSTCADPNYCTYFAGNITDIPGWIVAPGSVDLITGYWQAPPGGGNSVDLDGFFQAGGISQIFATTIGQTYRVDFELSGNPDAGSSLKTLLVDAVGVGFNIYTYTTGTNTHANMQWSSETFTFTALGPVTVLDFLSLDFPTSAWGPVIGNVDVSAIAGVPEPATLALFGAGLAGLGALRRRRKAKA